MSLKSASQHHNFMSLGCFVMGEVASRNSKETQSSCSFCTIRGLPRFWVDYLYTCRHCQELMKSVGSSGGSSALLSMMKVIWSDTLWACNSHKAMTALIVRLPSNCCCGDFSAISIDMSQICTLYLHSLLASRGLKSVSHIAGSCGWKIIKKICKENEPQSVGAVWYELTCG
jgi:hypothetical protein